jgi:hypothetical protein
VSRDATNAEKLKSFNAMAAKLSLSAVERLLQLSQSPKYGMRQSLLSTWQTNGLPIRYESTAAPGTTNSALQARKEAAVFSAICRIDHSCSPTCHAEWNDKTGHMTLHAIRDVPAGDELSICYLAPRGLERHERRARLLDEVHMAARSSVTRHAVTTSSA